MIVWEECMERLCTNGWIEKVSMNNYVSQKKVESWRLQILLQSKIEYNEDKIIVGKKLRKHKNKKSQRK